MPRRFQQVCSFLLHNAEVGDYLAAIERNAQLLRAVRGVLPPPLDQHCHHASLEDGVLTLITDSPVWSSRLRFFAPELKRILTQRHAAVDTCRIRIQPDSDATLSEAAANKRNSLSAGTVHHLMDVASGVADPDLAAALRRLAKAGAMRS